MQMQTIDLGMLDLEEEDSHCLKKQTSFTAPKEGNDEPYPSLKIIQNKDYWYKTSPKVKRKFSQSMLSERRRCLSESLEDPLGKSVYRVIF